MRRIALMIGVVAALAAGSPASASTAAWDCPEGSVCFWTGPAGTGSRCTWDQNDDDWTNSPVVCSWANTHNVKSVWNNSDRGNGVVYFSKAKPNSDNDGRIGCTQKRRNGDLKGTYKIRAHRWTSERCG